MSTAPFGCHWSVVSPHGHITPMGNTNIGRPGFNYCWSVMWNALSVPYQHPCQQTDRERPPSTPLDNIRVMVIVWRLRGNNIRTALCWIVWHNVYSQQHTYMNSSYRSNRLGSSQWDPYAVHRGGCLELYYCNMVGGSGGIQAWSLMTNRFSFSALTLLVLSSGL